MFITYFLINYFKKHHLKKQEENLTVDMCLVVFSSTALFLLIIHFLAVRYRYLSIYNGESIINNNSIYVFIFTLFFIVCLQMNCIIVLLNNIMINSMTRYIINPFVYKH